VNSKKGPDNAHSILTSKLKTCLFFFLNFKGTPSQEEHKTIFSSFKINEMALSDQIDFPAFFHLHKMTYWNFINSGIRQSANTFAP
jgi:hypothetical protein